MNEPEGFESDGPGQIWGETRVLQPEGAGSAYSRPDGENLRWLCPNEAYTGTPVLHRECFSGDKMTAPVPVAHVPTPGWPDDDYLFLLATGRILEYFDVNTMSYRIPDATLWPSDTLDIAPTDAARHGLIEGDVVRATSRYNPAILSLYISHTMQTGQLLCGFHRVDLLVNRLTSPVRDWLVHAPEYKVTAVWVKKRNG